jgi:hypothetical protein
MPLKSLRSSAERWTASIRQSLSQPPKRLIQSAQGTSELPGSDRQINWILSRSFLRQNVFEVAESLAESKRKSALALLVRKWAPFATMQFAAHWSAHRATVYAWDSARVNEAMTAAGYNPLRCTVWPETFFRPPMTDGARLSAMLDGFEGQVWRQGALSSTRWWPAMPSPADWMIFLRTSGIDLSQLPRALPAPTESELLELPWTMDNQTVGGIWGLVQNDRGAAIAATVVAAPFLYLAAQAGVLGIGTMRAEAAISGMSTANQSLRAERNAALVNLDAIEAYLALAPQKSQFELIAAAANLLRDKKISVGEWTYDNGNLEVMLQSDRPIEAPYYIELFEGDDHFSSVGGSLGNQERELRLKMIVDTKGLTRS